jgi:hypothetical protein
MKCCSLVLGLAALVCLTGTARPAQDTYEPDADGYIRNWLILAPIPLEAGQNGADGLNKVGMKDEGAILPKENDKAIVNDKQYIWKKCQCQDSHIDFNEFLGNQTEDSVAYAVCYIWAEQVVSNLKMKMGSDDQAKVYFNGKEILKCEEPRPLTKDQDTSENITLKKGRNVIVFKVVNEKVDFSGSIRFVDAAGKTFTHYKITVAP